jgi:hypothetical protein
MNALILNLQGGLVKKHSKECLKCHVVKELCEFSPHKKARDGFTTECRLCRRNRVNTYNHSEAGIAASHKPRSIFGRYQQRAKLRGIVFKLTFAEFMKFWQVPCSYCLTQISTIGIDRVDNNLGYLPSNVVSCCITCNRMKLTSCRDEFIEQCRRIVMTADKNTINPLDS